MALTSLNVYTMSHPLRQMSLYVSHKLATGPSFGSSDLIGSLKVQSEMTLKGMSSDPHYEVNSLDRENGRRNVFMTKSPRKNVPDVGIELEAACSAKQTRFRSRYRARRPVFKRNVHSVCIVWTHYSLVNYSVQILG